jgi:hypothetical protein
LILDTQQAHLSHAANSTTPPINDLLAQRISFEFCKEKVTRGFLAIQATQAIACIRATLRISMLALSKSRSRTFAHISTMVLTRLLTRYSNSRSTNFSPSIDSITVCSRQIQP